MRSWFSSRPLCWPFLTSGARERRPSPLRQRRKRPIAAMAIKTPAPWRTNTTVARSLCNMKRREWSVQCLFSGRVQLLAAQPGTKWWNARSILNGVISVLICDIANPKGHITLIGRAIYMGESRINATDLGNYPGVFWMRLTRVRQSYFYNTTDRGRGAISPLQNSGTTRQICKIRTAFNRSGKFVEENLVLLTSGSLLTSQVRQK